jgi:hypothetical protein
MRARSSTASGALLGALLLTGCSGWFWGGAAAGAAGAGAVYEHQNKQALDDLEDDYEEGKIDKDEYLRRKKEIQDRSVVY